MHLSFNDNSSFSFSSHTMGDSSSSSTSSSCHSSNYCPHTPTSGRSTPRSNSLDFGSSFSSSGSFAVHLTPPSSATSAYFPRDLNMTGDGSDFLQTPVTPTRDHMRTNFSDLSLGGCDGQPPIKGSGSPLCSINTAAWLEYPDYFSFEDVQSRGMLFTPDPTAPTRCDLEASSMWCNPDSPFGFENLSNSTSRSVKREPIRGQPMAPNLDKFRQNTARLHEAQRTSTTRVKKQIKRKGLSPAPTHTVAKKSSHICDFLGCTLSYQRLEHLKRHQKTIHQMPGEVGPSSYKCPLCQAKPFNRLDNWKIHAQLHCNPSRRSPRVKLIPGAMAVVDKTYAMFKAQGTREGKARKGMNEPMRS
ncbi:hypothetical protein B0H66DRAFT_627489 [Apodospora peruviana]|uniref:C2H2-type domain-containing protein n=1 Tax=Apodospora peruviana TaxID=516989 RepID=A0AAE0HY60_9PEZI|nr:hypothetical protein B0H66DRAFT_627489 [Apodospora peruviana]